jgi:hypothetical protein
MLIFLNISLRLDFSVGCTKETKKLSSTEIGSQLFSTQKGKFMI